MMRSILSFVAISLLVGGCQHGNVFDLLNPKQQPRVSQATFCSVMDQQGGAFRWSKNDTRLSKERADQLNAAWVRLCR